MCASGRSAAVRRQQSRWERIVGLDSSQDQSRDRDHQSRSTPVEAVWRAIRLSPTAKGYFERIQRYDPERKKIAVVATAHSLARVCGPPRMTPNGCREFSAVTPLSILTRAS